MILTIIQSFNYISLFVKHNDNIATNSFEKTVTHLYVRYFTHTLFKFNFKVPSGKDHDFQQH